jgi:hypothetical protein
MRGWPTHRLKLRVSGQHLSRATGTVFLFGIMVGAVAPLLTGSRRTADTMPDAQRSTWHSSTKSATPGSNTNNEPTPSKDHQRRRIKPQRAAAEVHCEVRWSPGRQPMTTGG